jgi:hypothetical protein
MNKTHNWYVENPEQNYECSVKFYDWNFIWLYQNIRQLIILMSRVLALAEYGCVLARSNTHQQSKW